MNTNPIYILKKIDKSCAIKIKINVKENNVTINVVMAVHLYILFIVACQAFFLIKSLKETQITQMYTDKTVNRNEHIHKTNI